MSSTYPLRIEAGATYARTFRIKNKSDGSDFDLTGYTGLAQIRENHDSPLVLEISPVINPALATVSIRIEAEDTSDLLLSNYVWALELYTTTDTVRLIEGPVTVSPEVVK